MNRENRSVIEPLETRIAPAVTVSFTTGALTLSASGTPLDAAIIAVDGDSFIIAGGPGVGIVFNGAPEAAFVRITGPVKSLTVTGTAGDDTLGIDALGIAGDATIDLGSGENEIDLSSTTIGGSLSVKTTGDSDSVKLTGSTLVVRKNLTIDLGAGTNALTADAALTSIGGDFSYTSSNPGTPDSILATATFAVGGNASFKVDQANIVIDSPIFKVGKNLRFDSTVAVAGGAGNVLAIGGTEVAPKSTLLSVGGDLTYLGGANPDTVTILGLGSASVKGVLKFDTGVGDASVQVTLSKLNARQVQFTSAADSSVLVGLGVNGAIPGGIQVTTGNGNDAVKLLVGGNVGPISANLGKGGNEVELFSNSILRGLRIVGGEDYDKLGLTFAGSSGPVVCELGDGANDATIQAGLSIRSSVAVTGGKDADKLTLKLSGASGAVTADLGDGNNNAALTLSGKFAGIQLTTGDDADTVIWNVIGSAKTVALDLGNGTDTAQVNFQNSSVAGLSVNHGEGLMTLQSILFSSRIAGGITVNARQDGSTTVFGTDSSVGGLVRFTHGAHTSYAGGVVVGTNFTIGGIDASLGDGGSNAIALGGTGIDVKGSVRLIGGNGIDLVQIAGAANLRIRKGIDFAGGEGTGGIDIKGSNLNIASVKASGGSSLAGIGIEGTGVIGPITGDFGTGGGGVVLTRTDAPLIVKSISSTSAGLAAAADTITLTGIQVLGNTTIQLGAGDSMVTIDDALFSGPVDLRTGAGADTVKIDTTLANLGTTIARAAVTIDLGEGDDILTLGDPADIAGVARVIARSTFTASGGGGTNTLTNPVTNVFEKTKTFTGF